MLLLLNGWKLVFFIIPSDTFMGKKGLYLDKGFNVKFLFTKNRYLPNFAIV